MRIKSVAISNIGRIRQNNEDNFYLCGIIRKNLDQNNLKVTYEADGESFVFAVCDGMGGAANGEIASLIATETLDDYCISFDDKSGEFFLDANDRICSEIKKNGNEHMGTTCSVLSLSSEIAHAYNIGDSRIYLIRNGKIKILSRDHTLAQMMVDQELLDCEDIHKHKSRHILTQYLGILPEEMRIEPFFSEPEKIREGDMFLLTSDGLTDSLRDADLLKVLSSDLSIENKAETIVEMALLKGGEDNITVLIVETDMIRKYTMLKFISKSIKNTFKLLFGEK